MMDEQLVSTARGGTHCTYDVMMKITMVMSTMSMRYMSIVIIA